MPGFEMHFRMDNAAFAFPHRSTEVARILLDIHNRVLHDGRTEGTILDLNGNKIGQWSIDPEDDDED